MTEMFVMLKNLIKIFLDGMFQKLQVWKVCLHQIIFLIKIFLVGMFQKLKIVYMFYQADQFNQDISGWERTTIGNTSTLANVKNMSYMFGGFLRGNLIKIFLIECFIIYECNVFRTKILIKIFLVGMFQKLKI